LLPTGVDAVELAGAGVDDVGSFGGASSTGVEREPSESPHSTAATRTSI